MATLVHAASAPALDSRPMRTVGLSLAHHGTLASGDVPPTFVAHMAHLLDEAPLPVIVMAIEEAAARGHVPPRTVWRNVGKLAKSLSVHRQGLCGREARCAAQRHLGGLVSAAVDALRRQRPATAEQGFGVASSLFCCATVVRRRLMPIFPSFS